MSSSLTWLDHDVDAQPEQRKLHALYPEEIAALLDRGELAIVEKVYTGGQDLRIAPVPEQPSWLIDRLIALYSLLRWQV